MQLTVKCIECGNSMIISETELQPVVTDAITTTTAKLNLEFEAKLATVAAAVQVLEQQNKVLQAQIDTLVAKPK